MRVSEKQILQFHESIDRFFKKVEYQLFLYGSRTQDHLKGGDIDLLIITNDNGILLFNEFYLDILVDLKKKSEIGQRRIDLKAALTEDLKQDPFLKTIQSELVKI